MIESKSTYKCDICGKEVQGSPDLFPTMLPYTYDPEPEPERTAGVKTTETRWARFDLCANCKRKLANYIKHGFVDIQTDERLPDPTKTWTANLSNFIPGRTKIATSADKRKETCFG